MYIVILFYACVKFKTEAPESGSGSAQVNPRVCRVIEGCLHSVKGSACVCCKLTYWDIKHWCLFSKLAARMGAYFRGVLIFMGCLFSWGANKRM